MYVIWKGNDKFQFYVSFFFLFTAQKEIFYK